MRRKHGVDNYREAQNPDCSTCAERKECASAQEGKFCTKWHREKTQREEPNPNDLWEQGEDVII